MSEFHSIAHEFRRFEWQLQKERLAASTGNYGAMLTIYTCILFLGVMRFHNGEAITPLRM